MTTWQNRVPPLVEKFQARDEEAQAAETELQQARERIAELETSMGPDTTRIEPVDPTSLIDGLNASNDPIDGATGEFETELVDQNTSYNENITEDAPNLLDTHLDDNENLVGADVLVNDIESVADDADDLKQIKGVGPAIEKTLNDLGIYRFNQIAEMSEYDIDRVAQQLKGFRSRIYREDWVGQARNLHYQKNNDPA